MLLSVWAYLCTPQSQQDLLLMRLCERNPVLS